MIDRYEIIGLLPEGDVCKKTQSGEWCKSEDVERLEKERFWCMPIWGVYLKSRCGVQVYNMNNKKIWHELNFATPQYNIQVWCRKNAEIPTKISFILLENSWSIFNAWMIRSGKYNFKFDKSQMNFDYASMLFRYCIEYAVKNMEMVVK